ncbi:MAG: response regulator [Verrucomicrobiales bacterium]|nr:response regulator [Verrucomicrobiales bacterium]
MKKRKEVGVLLVDDSAVEGVLVESCMEMPMKLDATIPDGEQAMAYLRKEGEYSHARTPDLILLDINMPEKNGFEVLAEIREDKSLSTIPIVMFTTSDEESDIRKAYSMGANSYIEKPPGIDRLTLILKSLADYWTSTSRIPSPNE